MGHCVASYDEAGPTSESDPDLRHQNKSSGFKQGKSRQIGMNDNLRRIQHKMHFGELNKDLVKNATFVLVFTAGQWLDHLKTLDLHYNCAYIYIYNKQLTFEQP